MNRTIDLNADVGEKPQLLADGSEEELLRLVTSANVACGGHAGTRETMANVIAIASRHGVAIGAHPSYPDPAQFGRVEMDLPADALEQSISEQVATLVEVARAHGAQVHHVKPHGALYNQAAKSSTLASTIARALLPLRDTVTLVGLAGSTMLATWQGMGFRVTAEAFADRRYEPDGTLRSRRHADALLTEPGEAAQQAVDIVVHRRARTVAGSIVPVHAGTLCIHGDTPHAIAISRAIREALEEHGVEIRPIA
jgi:5-oxoprolinase (ATP-hydrolysing) subunit A